MPSIHLQGVSYAYSSATPILTDADLDLASTDAPWVGLVGANGVGKSTLLRLCAGHVNPSVGQVISQASMPPVLVPQEVNELTDEVQALAWRWDNRAQQLRRRLALEPDDPSELEGRWLALSPGQRKRWQLAAAFVEDPEIVLLDEPTNHLDASARQHLLDVLKDFRGLGLIVSHDRAVLDRLTARTVRIQDCALELHAGSYTSASQRWSADAAARRQEYDRARSEVRRQRRILGEVRRDRHSAEAGPRRTRRLAGASDPDAREAGRKSAQRKAEAALAQRVKQMNSRVDRAQSHLEAFDLQREHGGQVGFQATVSRRRVVARVTGTVVHAGGAAWLRDVEVALARGEHVHVTGANGAGKTTLLRAVSAAIDEAEEDLALLPQELDDPTAELDRLQTLDPQQRGRVLGVVALLGVDPDRLLVTDEPSPGEGRKLALAHLLAGEASVLILDEPTNHMDLPSIERLQVALERWEGALLLVSHDEALAAAVTTTTWQVANGRVHVHRRDGPEGTAR